MNTWNGLGLFKTELDVGVRCWLITRPPQGRKIVTVWPPVTLLRITINQPTRQLQLPRARLCTRYVCCQRWQHPKAMLQWRWPDCALLIKQLVALSNVPNKARWVQPWRRQHPGNTSRGHRRESAPRAPAYSDAEYQARPSASSAAATATYLLGNTRGGRHSSRKRSSSVFGRFLVGDAAGGALA